MPSGGHNKKTLSELRRAGTFRPDRHRHLVGDVDKSRARFFGVPSSQPLKSIEEPPVRATLAERRHVTAGLRADGRHFVRSIIAKTGDLDPLDLQVLRALAASIDRQAELTAAMPGALRADGLPGEHPLARSLRAELRLFTSLTKQFKAKLR